MPTIDELRRRVWDLYAEPTPQQRTTFLENLEAGPLLESAGPEPIRQFSVFNHLHAERAAQVYDEFFELAEQRETIEEGVEAVLGRYSELKGSENPELLYHALSVFITHHRYGKVLTIPDIVVREPELAMSSKSASSIQMPGLENFDDAMGGASGDEGKLDWFREDPQQNEHHAHWHNVYPTNGVPVPGTNQRKYKDRQGEMFLYMHQQMLARYEVERIALGLSPLEAYTFNAPIPSGYNPGNFITAETGRTKRNEDTEVSISVFARQNGQIVFSYTPQQHRSEKRRLDEALQARTLRGNGPDNDENKIRVADRLGHTLEPSGPPEERIPGFGNYHGMGHVLIAKSHLEGEVDLDNSSDGVMAVPNTAIRDSIFYRWHRHIDDYSFAVQEQFGVRQYGDAPSVFFDHKTTDESGDPLSADIILCLNRDIPGMHPDFDGKTFGKLAFGGGNWNKDFSSGEFTVTDPSGREVSFRTTDTLLTSMNKGEIKFRNNNEGETHEYDYLNHEPFCYFLRIRNNGPARTITFRIFLVPEGTDPQTGKPYEENRRLWIEMDKVLADLERNSNNVFFQFDRKSSVVRKPAEDPAKMNLEYTPSILDGGILQTMEQVFEWELKLRAYYLRQVKTPNLQTEEQNLLRLREALQANPSQQRQDAYISALMRYRGRITEEVAYCDCGWPYNLLVPRGTKEGMKFRLMVMATDAAFDVDEIGCCGSMSYCGAKDSYPDKRPMGYPFDRPFPEEGIVNTLNALSNVAFRSISIQCTNLDEFES